MNEELGQPVLAELRRLNRAARINQLLTGFTLGLFFIYLIVLRPLRLRDVGPAERQPAEVARSSAKTKASVELWPRIQDAIYRGDNQTARVLAEDYTKQLPNYYYSHAILGTVCVDINDLPGAETAYARAFALYPGEDVEKALAVVRKTMAAGQTSTNSSLSKQ